MSSLPRGNRKMENCRVHVSSISPRSTVGGSGGWRRWRRREDGFGGSSEDWISGRWVRRRRAGDEKRFDEKMERGCGKRVRGREGRGVVAGGCGRRQRRRSGDENLQDAGDAERVLSGTKKWLFLLECARCTCTFSRKTDGRGAGRMRERAGRGRGRGRGGWQAAGRREGTK